MEALRCRPFSGTTAILPGGQGMRREVMETHRRNGGLLVAFGVFSLSVHCRERYVEGAGGWPMVLQQPLDCIAQVGEIYEVREIVFHFNSNLDETSQSTTLLLDYKLTL